MALPNEAKLIVCVADGTGGISGGAKAAELFVDGVRRATLDSSFGINDPAAWIALLEALDKEIALDPLAGETTGVALVVASGMIVGASCGDSKAYLYGPSGWQELTSCQLRKPRLGTGQAKAKAFLTEAHGTLVVGTDGLFDYVSLDDMAPILLRASDEAGNALVRLVLDQHKRLLDDISVVVWWSD